MRHTERGLHAPRQVPIGRSVLDIIRPYTRRTGDMEKQRQEKVLTVHEIHVRVCASDARIARKLPVPLQRLCLLVVDTESEVNRRIQVDANVPDVVDVVEIGVEEVGEVLHGCRVCEQVLLWRQLVQVGDVLGHVGPAMPFVGGHSLEFAGDDGVKSLGVAVEVEKLGIGVLR
jgi:hypothetical protein